MDDHEIDSGAPVDHTRTEPMHRNQEATEISRLPA